MVFEITLINCADLKKHLYRIGFRKKHFTGFKICVSEYPVTDEMSIASVRQEILTLGGIVVYLDHKKSRAIVEGPEGLFPLVLCEVFRVPYFVVFSEKRGKQHIVKLSSASEIRKSLGITKKDHEAAMRALRKDGGNDC